MLFDQEDQQLQFADRQLDIAVPDPGFVAAPIDLDRSGDVHRGPRPGLLFGSEYERADGVDVVGAGNDGGSTGGQRFSGDEVGGRGRTDQDRQLPAAAHGGGDLGCVDDVGVRGQDQHVGRFGTDMQQRVGTVSAP
ncbi:Uncharacterised protein [Mycobacteroides abscessus subsp. abscessus]|nr:Uncharacterised protein [Mycobacteroides abscessus subsp. abscessus]